MKNSYKYFKYGDKIISIKRRKHFRIYRESLDNIPMLFKVYTFDRYIPFLNGTPDYRLLMVKDDIDYVLYNGLDFISLKEYRKLKLKNIEKKSYFKNFFKKYKNE